MLFTLTPPAPGAGYGDALLPLPALKAWLRVDGDDEDELITALRDVAINAVEQYANLRMGPCQGLQATFQAFGRSMRMGLDPVATLVVTAVSYLDRTGVSVDLTDGDWRIGSDGALLPAIGAQWPTGSTVRVTFDVGFPADTCPPSLITAAKMFAAHLYSNREAVVFSGTAGELPLGFCMLCDPYRTPVL